MSEESQNKIIELLKIRRADTIKAISNLLNGSNVKIKVPKKVLEELFIEKVSEKDNGEGVDASEFIMDDSTLSIYKYFDFSDFVYSNLILHTKINGFNRKIIELDLMRDNNITFYTDKIINKDISYQKLNGILVQGSFDNWDIRYTDFTSVRGFPVVHPSNTKEKSMQGTILKDAYLSGSCKGVDITKTDFTGAAKATNFKIDPSEVLNKDLTHTIFNGINIVGSFDGSKLYHTDFSNANVLPNINPDKLSLPIISGDRKLTGNNFFGVTFDGELSSCALSDNNFTGSYNAVIDFKNSLNISHLIDSNNIFTDVTFKNINLAPYDFLCKNKNSFNNTKLEYNVHNRDISLEWSKNSSYNIITINRDSQLEEDILDIFNPEIIKAKKKK